MAKASRHAPILLELDLSQPLVEQEPSDPLGKIRSRGKPRLRPVLRTLHEAGTDPDRKSTRLNSSHTQKSRMPSSA